MRTAFFCFAFLYSAVGFAQYYNWEDQRLNTAKDVAYLTKAEKEMIYEINRLRSDPMRYAKVFIWPLYKESLSADTINSSYQYSVSTTYTNDSIVLRDTVWQNAVVETKKALKSLYNRLQNIQPLQILQPDKGIYKACSRYAKDQKPTGDLNHRGTDGSWPWDRINKYSPSMKSGNENLACGAESVRSIVLQLLIDSGIDGYGHRDNLLNPLWTHVACLKVGPLKLSCQYWIQNFGTTSGR